MFKIIRFKAGLWMRVMWGKFMRSRFLLGLLMLTIGISYTVCFYEIENLGVRRETKKVIILHRENEEEIGALDSPVAYASTKQQLDSSNSEEERTESPSTPPAVSEIEREIREIFGKDSKIALAVFKTESALDPTNQNWNCYYNGKSDICKPADRHRAWSVDCGVAQINHIGKECPKELFNYRENIRIAKEMFDRRGFQPWVTYNEGYYLANL